MAPWIHTLLIAIPIVAALALVMKAISFCLSSRNGKRQRVEHVVRPMATRPSTFVPSTKVDHPGDARRPSTIAPVTHSTPTGDDGFTNSLILGMATDNTLLATALGGSLAGAMVGVALDDSMRSSDTPSPAPAADICQPDTSQTSSGNVDATCCPDSSSYDTGSSTDAGSCDMGSSFDTGSSFDSGSSGSW